MGSVDHSFVRRKVRFWERQLRRLEGSVMNEASLPVRSHGLIEALAMLSGVLSLIVTLDRSSEDGIEEDLKHIRERLLDLTGRG